MNVLILTPDRVGSTLLQRVLTIYMLRREFDKPVINLHELTNGLESYYNTTLNQTVLGKPRGTDWGYYQTLGEITELLKSTDHYKTSRLTHYHIINRKDSIGDQLPFYEYLNNNFYIISARRRNLFEYALSWIINAHSKKLNVYSIREKISTFHDLYKNKITADRESFISHLEGYKQYIQWSDEYFQIQSIFNYEDNIFDLEKYILNLDFMQNAKNNTWQDMFGQTYNQYNTCHRTIPNLLLYEQSGNNKLTLSEAGQEYKWNQIKDSNWPEFDSVDADIVKTLPEDIREKVNKIIPSSIFKKTVSINDELIDFFNQNLQVYKNTSGQIDDLVRDGFLVTGIPVKLQSLAEKKMLIKNFSDTIEWYNEWAVTNGYEVYSEDSIIKLANQEETNLNCPIIESTNLPAVK